MATTEVTLTFTVEHEDEERVTPYDVAVWLEESLPTAWFDPDEGDYLWFSKLSWKSGGTVVAGERTWR